MSRQIYVLNFNGFSDCELIENARKLHDKNCQSSNYGSKVKKLLKLQGPKL